jgi:hypothetical protein
VVACLFLAAALLAGALWTLPRALSQPTSSPTRRAPTPVPTYTPTPRLIPDPTATPTSAVLHPTITDREAVADDAAGRITFSLKAQVPPDREVAEALLWYDTEAGHKVRRFPGPLPNSVSLSYELVAAQEGMTRTVTSTQELDYWWLVRDTAGESARAGGSVVVGPKLLASGVTPTGVPADFTWSISTTRHYEFHYPPGTAAERDISRLGAIAEASFEKVRSKLGADFVGQMKLYLVPRVFWQGGATYGDKVQLISYLDRNYTGVETWSYFAHEGTHSLAQDLIQPKEEGGPDGVLVEGLAVWASGGHYGPEPIDAWAAVVAASDNYLPLAKLRAGPFYDFQHETSYLEAGSFVGYLMDQYGLDKFKQLYGRATGKAETDETLVGELYGKAYAELEGEWLEYLKALVPTPEEAKLWHLQVRSFDLMRRYETQMDPDARILPDKPPPEWSDETLRVFLNHRQETANVVLETTLIAAQERIKAGDLVGATALLDDVEAALDAHGEMVRPSLQARQLIINLVHDQDRAVLRADADGYLATFGASYAPPATLGETLQLPFTAYEQEVVRLDVAEDGQSAQGVVWLHAQVAERDFAEDGRLWAVTFALEQGRWQMVSREATQWVPELPPPTVSTGSG